MGRILLLLNFSIIIFSFSAISQNNQSEIIDKMISDFDTSKENYLIADSILPAIIDYPGALADTCYCHKEIYRNKETNDIEKIVESGSYLYSKDSVNTTIFFANQKTIKYIYTEKFCGITTYAFEIYYDNDTLVLNKKKVSPSNYGLPIPEAYLKISYLRLNKYRLDAKSW